MRVGVLGLALSALAFSISYAFVEYYVIRDASFGYHPVLFSLIYPYHFAMAAVFAAVVWGMLRIQTVAKGLGQNLILAGLLFSGMLAVEDFMWFTLRAAAPVQGDLNAGRLVLHDEWTTQFMGSVDAYFTAIPNWYFLSVGLLAGLATAQGRRRVAVAASP